MVLQSLAPREREDTVQALLQLTGASSLESALAGTLVREIEPSAFDYKAVPWNRKVRLSNENGPVTFDIPLLRGTEALPREWQITPLDGRRLRVTVPGDADALFPASRVFEVGAAGQLPTGFNPGALYPSRNHPRGLQMTVFAASDALADLGISWSEVTQRVPPQAISVYASSSMGQLDDDGTGGMLAGRANGQRVSSKQCPLGFAEMPGDFINAYLLKSMGTTGPALGACATFLYNLRLAVNDIRAGRSRVAIVGASEAPILPTVMEGYIAMGALATDKELRALDGLSDDQAVDYRRACRPFAENCGFTMAESAQVIVLFDDALALELGAPIQGAVADVFVNADGAKKSISSPGAGNYITVARALTAIRDILGEQKTQRGGFVQAHGTGTPQNRVTESAILNRVAAAFGISSWPVAAIKSFVGHSLGAASGDQLTATLGMWAHGLLPGIETIGAIADDVHQAHLQFALQTDALPGLDYALVNSKGFGGNNATAAVLSPRSTEQLLAKGHGDKALHAWRERQAGVNEARYDLEQQRLRGDWSPEYYFDDGVLQDEHILIDNKQLTLGDHVVALTRSVPENWSLDD
jgi:acetoacetyl-[acyl-carrier protein] synthase